MAKLGDMAASGICVSEDFNPEQVGDWIDEMPAEVVTEVQNVLLGAMSLRNPNRANLAKLIRIHLG